MIAALLVASLYASGWQPVPLVTAEQRTAGFKGGEVAQWPRSLEYSQSDPNFALYGTDVGGIFRSFDAGVTWSTCNVGYTPRGCTDFAIDPRNAHRILAVGMNSGPGAHHGLYLSEDKGASWRPVFTANIASNDDMREQVAFDPASYDEATKRTKVAYWSRVRNDNEAWGNKPEIKPRLYRSEDGGSTWIELPNSEPYGGSIVKVTAGAVFCGNERGLFRSDDRGLSFRQVFTGDVTGFDVCRSEPQSLWVSTPDSIWKSETLGRNWTKLGTPWREGQDRFRGLRVSPVDPLRFALWRDAVPNNWHWPRFVTHDGGKSWTEAKKDSAGAFLPDNTRQGLYAWHHRDPQLVLSIGGDWVTRSTDGGKTFRYSSQGDNGVLVGGRFAFSAVAANTIFFGSQDYNGAVTFDSGRTWTYTNISGLGWGGYCYGGYAVTKSFLIAGNADGWGGTRVLRVSQDGGKTWKDTGIKLSGPDVSYGVPGKPLVAFAFDHRTQDGGQTWKKMAGCEGVFTHRGTTLYGRMGKTLVKSADQGITWVTVAEAPEPIEDIAAGENVFVVAGQRAFRLVGNQFIPLDTPKDADFGNSVRSVAVDPRSPKTVYVGSAGNYFTTSCAVLRSTDGGQTWQVLTQRTQLQPGDVDGGREAICVRVHPRTGHLIVSTSCYGIWRWIPPTE